MAISAKDLIKKKKLIEDKKDKLIEIEVPNTGTFVFRLPTIEDSEDAEAYGKNRNNPGFEQNKYLVHACCVEPRLSDPELLEAFEVTEPIDIVSELFLMGEISSIAMTLVEKAGFDKESYKVVEKAKNS